MGQRPDEASLAIFSLLITVQESHPHFRALSWKTGRLRATAALGLLDKWKALTLQGAWQQRVQDLWLPCSDHGKDVPEVRSGDMECSHPFNHLPLCTDGGHMLPFKNNFGFFCLKTAFSP